MKSKYIFITNIEKLAYQHYKLILDLLKIDYKITKSTEFNDCLSVYFLDEKENMLKLKAFFDLHCDVTTRYKQKMIDSGFATEEELRANRDYYMGCEREYFPDRDNTVLKNFKYGESDDGEQKVTLTEHENVQIKYTDEDIDNLLDSFDYNNSDFEDINDYDFDHADDD